MQNMDSFHYCNLIFVSVFLSNEQRSLMSFFGDPLISFISQRLLLYDPLLNYISPRVQIQKLFLWSVVKILSKRFDYTCIKI